MQNLDARSIDGEEVIARPKTMSRVIEEKVEPSRFEGDEEPKMDKDAKSQEDLRPQGA
jgi:hypothetical protein